MKTILLLASIEMCSEFQYVLSEEYNILTCFDPVAGAAMLSRKPDALILNLSLPGSSGLDFLIHNKSSLPPVVIALTPFINNALLAKLDQLNVDAAFLIPCAMSRLKESLSNLLTKKCPSW